MAPDREAEELEWQPLAEIADKWLHQAKLAAEMVDPTFQELIDALPDHNQTMIDAIEETSLGIDSAITELMEAGTDDATAAWTGLVNHIFSLAKSQYEDVDNG